jgi:hypothetical protein
MKKTIQTLSLIILTALFIMPFQGCGKYEEGPSFSLRTKKGRLCQSWTIDKFVDPNGNETAGTVGDGVYTYEKDGTYSWSDGSVSVSGTWEFDASKENIETTLLTVTVSAKIIKLTSSELWGEDSDGYQIHLKAE